MTLVPYPQEDQSQEPPSTMQQYGPALAGAIATLGVGGGLYRALRKRTLSADPALRAIQEASRGQYTRVLPGTAQGRGFLGRLSDRYLGAGGGKVLYQDDLSKLMSEGGAAMKVPGLVHHSSRDFNNVLSGDVNLAANDATKALHDQLGNDKWKEYQLFQKHAPGAMGRSQSMADALKSLGHTKMPTTPEEQQALLGQLQEHLRQKYPKGFLLKDTQSAETAGAFPTEKTLFGDLHTRYQTENPRVKLRQMMAEQSEGLGPSERKALYKNIRQRVSNEHKDIWAGRVFDTMFKDPTKAMVQEKLPLTEGSAFGKLFGKLTNKPATQEMRLHVVNGALVPSLTIPRFDPSMYLTGRHHMRGAEDYTRGLLTKLPEKYRTGTFAMDVAPLKGGGYGLIESNPSGVSGFFNQKKMPIVGPLMHKAFTGQHSRPVAGALASTGAVAAGAGTYGLTRAATESAGQPGQGPLPPPPPASYTFRGA